MSKKNIKRIYAQQVFTPRHVMGVEAIVETEEMCIRDSYQTANTIKTMHGSQTASYKIRSQKGNSPDRQLRSPSVC